MSLCSLHIECVWKRGIRVLDVLSVYQEKMQSMTVSIILRGTLGLSRLNFRKCTLQAWRWEPMTPLQCFVMLTDSEKAFQNICE